MTLGTGAAAGAGAGAAGADGGAPPAGGGGAGLPVGSNAAAAVAAGGGAAPPAGGAIQSSPPWQAGLGEKSRALVELKKWGEKGPDAVYEAFDNAEKKLGASPDQLIRKARPDDPDGKNRMYAEWGRPETPDGYEIAMAEGGDKEFHTALLKTMHEAGYNKDQATAMAKLLGTQATALQTKRDAEFTARSQREVTEIKTEWGEAFPGNEKIAARGAETFFREEGQTNEQFGEFIDELESAVGYSKLMRGMLRLGQRLQEHGYIEGGGPAGNGPLSPTAAQMKLDSNSKDPEWMARWEGGDPIARQEKADLVRQINASKPKPFGR